MIAKNTVYKVLAAIYIVLLGVVLPFICWGTLATPGHPHRMAHLVFILPPMHAEAATGALESDPSVHQSHGGTADADQAEQAAQPVGRSVPDQLSSAISIIAPLLLVQILLLLQPAHALLRLSHRSTDHLFDPHVLTPPPRPLYS